MDKIKSIVSLIAIYAVLNLALWGGQELYYQKDTREIKKIEGYLDAEKNNISSLQQTIDNQSKELEKNKQELEILKNQKLVDEFNLRVDVYNSLLDDYKKNLDSYDEKLTQYNSEVSRVNELIKKSGSRWYLIPIPLPGRSARTKL